MNGPGYTATQRDNDLDSLLAQLRNFGNQAAKVCALHERLLEIGHVDLAYLRQKAQLAAEAAEAVAYDATVIRERSGSAGFFAHDPDEVQ